MARELIEAKVTVPKIGNPDGYINVPVIRDGVAIGVIVNCEEAPFNYILKLSIWQDVSIEINNNVISSIIIGGK